MDSPYKPVIKIEYHKKFSSLLFVLWSSSPGKFHPQALTDRYVTVSRHTAPARLPLESSRSQAYAKETRFLTVSWLSIADCELTHPLRSSPITGPSTLLREMIRPRVPPRYAHACGATTCVSPLASGRQVLTFRAKAWIKFMPSLCRTPPRH